MSTPEQPAAISIDMNGILKLLPHRYPFLLVDRVVSCTPGASIHAYKCVSVNEPFFQGHFPEFPVMPGVLIMEALAQAGGIMVVSSLNNEPMDDKLFLFTGMENVRFRRPVLPGDRLDLHCELLRRKLRLWKISGRAMVNGILAAEGELTAAISSKKEF